MKIAIGSDHGGYNLKEAIKKHLEKKGIEYRDFGTNGLESVDYPEFAMKVGEAVKSEEYERGILCCGTGIGISISANKVPGIRCAAVSDAFSAEMSRAHNNANVLALGERVIGQGLALKIVDIWIETGFEGGRHGTRVEKIGDIEVKYSK